MRVAYDLYFMASNENDLVEGFPYLNEALHLYHFCEMLYNLASNIFSSILYESHCNFI